jgi:hypothetical protein
MIHLNIRELKLYTFIQKFNTALLNMTTLISLLTHNSFRLTYFAINISHVLRFMIFLRYEDRTSCNYSAQQLMTSGYEYYDDDCGFCC